MALFGGSPKHPKLDQLSQIIQNSLGLQLSPPDEGVLGVIETMTPHDFIGVQNSRSVEGAQEIFKTKSLRVVIDNASRTIALSIAAPEEIDRELKAAHSAVSVFHVGEHHARLQSDDRAGRGNDGKCCAGRADRNRCSASAARI